MMLEQVVDDYAEYFKLDVQNGLQTVQDVVDNMLTRLEEVTSVLQMIKLKNSDCATVVSEEINKYRNEVTVLSKKIANLGYIITKLQHNIEPLEKQIEKAEHDFGVSNENKIKTFLKPFLMRKDNSVNVHVNTQFQRLNLESVMDNFEDTGS